MLYVTNGRPADGGDLDTTGGIVTSHARTSPPVVAVDFERVFDALPTAFLLMSSDLVIVDANEAYLQMLGRERADLVGRHLFEAFPASPEALDADGTNPVETSFRRAVETGRPDSMALQRYDVRDEATGVVVERFWSLISAPLLDESGRTVLLLQRVEDVTDFVHERERLSEGGPEGWREHTEKIEADLFLRAQELRAAQVARDLAARRVAALADVALALTGATTLADLEQIVLSAAPAVLGSEGGALIAAADGGWRLTTSGTLDADLDRRLGHVPYDSPLPAAWAARTGQRLLLPTVASGTAFHPVMTSLYADTGRLAWAYLPLSVQGERLGALIVSWVAEHAFTADEVELMDGFAAQCAQTLKRLRQAEEQQAAAASVLEFSEALQRSLLTLPAIRERLDVAVRYQPAASGAQVGGDWYDAFVTAAGGTVVAVGDITGHDRAAAAAMGQVRSLLRGIAYDSDDSPADLLNRLDAAMAGLELNTLATAVVARLEATEGPGGQAHRRLRWANAGHPPPVLRRADASVAVLAGVPDLLLGHDPQASRRDHLVELAAGDTVLLYTDGLVERRDVDLDEGLARLLDVVARHGGAPIEDLADAVLLDMGTVDGEDDTAVLVLRLG